jgi:hypothetical protein
VGPLPREAEQEQHRRRRVASIVRTGVWHVGDLPANGPGVGSRKRHECRLEFPWLRDGLIATERDFVSLGITDEEPEHRGRPSSAANLTASTPRTFRAGSDGKRSLSGTAELRRGYPTEGLLQFSLAPTTLPPAHSASGKVTHVSAARSGGLAALPGARQCRLLRRLQRLPSRTQRALLRLPDLVLAGGEHLERQPDRCGHGSRRGAQRE